MKTQNWSETELGELLKTNSQLKEIGQFSKKVESSFSNRVVVPSETITAKGIPFAPKMNKLETRYADYLELQKHLGKVIWWRYEPFGLRLANPKCFYHIDFAHLNDKYELILTETKGGFVRDDSLIKFKVASETFPHFLFQWVTWVDNNWVTKTLHGGKWSDEK